ncbi:MAG: MCE family protein [Candidatus Zixiibacteriota bacterium]|nr:MAG: MCE family protein [candidate division Zixibacteria bacterium]
MAVDRSKVEFRVGLIILLGIVLVAVSLYWLQGYKLEVNAQKVYVRFNDVGALAVGDPVMVLGVHKGKVNHLSLVEDGVKVELLMYKDVKLKRDATFTIRNQGVMGDRFIAVNPGHDSLPLDTAQVVPGLYDTGLPEVMGLLGDMIVELRTMVSSLKATVASDSSLRRFNRTVSNFETVSASLGEYLNRNQATFERTAENFLAASEKIDRMLSTNTGKVDTTVERLNRVSERLERFTEQLDSLSASARHFADMLDNDEGSLQLLLQDRRLYDDLRRSADNIDDLVRDIRANPRKYINLKIELF